MTSRKMSKEDICNQEGPKDGTLMLLPPALDWPGGRDLCRRFLITRLPQLVHLISRFGGRLHIDSNKHSVEHRSYAMIAYGEDTRPERCKRPWLGASDIEEEGVWRDSETNDILNIDDYWGPGQPNGERIQNCAGIWEYVRDMKVFYIYILTSYHIGWFWT